MIIIITFFFFVFKNVKWCRCQLFGSCLPTSNCHNCKKQLGLPYTCTCTFNRTCSSAHKVNLPYKSTWRPSTLFPFGTYTTQLNTSLYMSKNTSQLMIHSNKYVYVAFMSCFVHSTSSGFFPECRPTCYQQVFFFLYFFLIQRT